MFPKFMTPPTRTEAVLPLRAKRCHCRQALSLRATTRNPVLAYHWIPDVETPDLIRGRDDKLPTRDDKLPTRDGKLPTRQDSGCLCARLDLWKVQ
jgi:hypothetical protein